MHTVCTSTVRPYLSANPATPLVEAPPTNRSIASRVSSGQIVSHAALITCVPMISNSAA